MKTFGDEKWINPWIHSNCHPSHHSPIIIIINLHPDGRRQLGIGIKFSLLLYNWGRGAGGGGASKGGGTGREGSGEGGLNGCIMHRQRTQQVHASLYMKRFGDEKWTNPWFHYEALWGWEMKQALILFRHPSSTTWGASRGVGTNGEGPGKQG
jgi:hypothetical protein